MLPSSILGLLLALACTCHGQETPASTPPSFRVLVVASRAHDHQKMIAAARPFLEKMAVDNHFSLDFTDDTSLINTANLSKYQVFVMLHLAPFDMSYSQQAALQHFVEEGKGWVGIHAAGLTGAGFLAPNTRYWQWFEDFMGGITYSPHPAYQKATVVVEDNDHPVTRHLPARVEFPDEWYEFNKSPRDRVRVLASVDESSYHQNKPMGDHPIIWTNERYRRMIYIAIGHDPVLLGDDNYATLLRDAILWAGTPAPAASARTPALHIPMKNGIINYEKQFTLGQNIPAAGIVRAIRLALDQPVPGFPDFKMTVTSADKNAGTLSGTGLFKVITSASDNYYYLKFDWSCKVTDGHYSFRTYNYYEKPVEPGISNEFSKIEYRWWDFRQGHPWSSEDQRLFEGLDVATASLLNSLYGQEDKSPPAGSSAPRFRVLALYENGGHHLEYSTRAKIWLNQLAADSNFRIDYITNTDSITGEFLSGYQLFLQLDYAPYAWKPAAVTAFQNYIEQGRGGWVGFHHATLLGEFDGYPMWPWFYDFMGGIRWKDYIARFARATVHVEDKDNPVMQGIPDSFVIQKEEWYTYDKSPRPNVHVIANVDESSYRPDTTVKMGDHPVIWSNPKVRARNVYIFMGHSPILFDDAVYKKIVSNAIFWAAGTKSVSSQSADSQSVSSQSSNPPSVAVQSVSSQSASPPPAVSARPPKFKALAFYSTTVESDHVDFARDAIRFYTGLAARKGFVFDTTTNFDKVNSDYLKDYQVVLWLNDFPKTDQQRTAFEGYMEHGGAWLGFHVAGYNDRYTNWPWFVRFLGGAVFYNNNWPPLPARLIVDDRKHPATHHLPSHYTAPINEWYGWQPNPRLNKDVRVLVTLDTANYPLGKKDIIREGDIPVIWTNTHYKMLYVNMGHGDQIFASPIQNRLFEDAILWMGSKK